MTSQSRQSESEEAVMAGDGGRVPDVSEQRAETAIWHGTPGHFIAAYSCCFRLHTTVGEYRVSTVGCYHSGGDRSQPPREIGSGRLYETMVFRNGPDAEPVDWAEIDGDAYSDELSAEAGHLAMCRKYGLDPASVLAALLAESPEATVYAIEALLTSDEARETYWDSHDVLRYADTHEKVPGKPWDRRASGHVRSACRSLLSKAPKGDRDA